MVRPLISYCETFLINNICAENVFTVLQYTIDCESDEKLKDKCAEVLSTKTKDVLKSEEFPKISLKCLEFLLNQDSLSASEVELFNAVCHFASHLMKKKIPNSEILFEKWKYLNLLSISFSVNKQIPRSLAFEFRICLKINNFCKFTSIYGDEGGIRVCHNLIIIVTKVKNSTL